MRKLKIKSAYLSFMTACIAAVFTCNFVNADTITSGGVVHKDCRIQTIRGGNVFFLDEDENLQQLSLEDITAIDFDNIRDLTDGDRYTERKDYLRALDKYQQAYVKAKNESQQFWLHLKLSETHNKLGDYIEAAGHAAAVIMVDPSEMWLKLLPDCEVNPSTFYSTAEADYFLGRASRQVKDKEELKRMIVAMQSVVAPLLAEQKAEKPNYIYRSGSTVSGILFRDLGTDRAKRERPWLDKQKNKLVSKPAEQNHTGQGGKEDIENKPGSPEAIDEFLSAGKYSEALAAIEIITRRTDSRDLARLLFQYGEALNGVGKRKDAAIEYMKCVANYSGSVYAPKSLIKTAIIYREVFKNYQTANQLLKKAVEKANEIGEGELAKQAGILLDSKE